MSDEITTAVATVSRPNAGLRPTISAEQLNAETEQRKLLGQYITSNMTDGVDYGVIPGTEKKTLLKPGAEKLTDLFRCTPKFTFLEKIEDWQANLFYYQFKCEIESREYGVVVAEGYGSCSTREKKYRWRNSDRACPACGKSTIIKGKDEYGGGWVCFAKKGGCGAKYKDDDQTIIGQTVGRVENEDVADYVNTVLKMAKKRAHVDAAISLARCSDMFTQDLDDLDHDDSSPPNRPNGSDNGKPAKITITPDQKAAIYESMKEAIAAATKETLNKGMYAAIEKDFPLIAPEQVKEIAALWEARRKELNKPVIDPEKSAKLANTIIGAINAAVTMADIDSVKTVNKDNFAKLTADDQARVVEAGKAKKEFILNPPAKPAPPPVSNTPPVETGDVW